MIIDRAATIEKAKKLLPQKGKRFKSNLLRSFLLAMMACAVFLLILTFYLVDYQKSLPADAAARILKAYDRADSEIFAQYNDALPSAFADDQRLAAYIELSFPEEKLYYAKGTAENADEIVYEFRAGNVHAATLTTVEIEETTFFGFKKYKVLSFVPHPIAYYSIIAPLDTHLMIDGSLLREKYPPIPGYPALGFEIVSTNNISEIYKIPDYDALGALSVKDATGEDYIIDVEDENYNVSVTLQPEQAIKAEIIDFARTFIKEYLVFTTKKNAARWPVVRLTYPRTEFYKTLQQYSNDWGKNYVSDRFDDLTVEEIKKYSASEYSCHISLTYMIVRSDGLVKNIDFDAMLYLTNRTGTWLAVNMIL